jgi:hypothetical protein
MRADHNARAMTGHVGGKDSFVAHRQLSYCNEGLTCGVGRKRQDAKENPGRRRASGMKMGMER